MKKVFVDTVAWIALLDRDDSLHSETVQIKERLRRENAQLITTDFIFLEVADGFSNRRFRGRVAAYIDGVRRLAAFEVIPVSADLYEEGWRLYTQRPDTNWGLTDCISFVVMKRLSIETVFTSDRHFEQAGFVRLMKG